MDLNKLERDAGRGFVRANFDLVRRMVPGPASDGML